MAKKRNTMGKTIRAQEKKRKSADKLQKRLQRQDARATESLSQAG